MPALDSLENLAVLEAQLDQTQINIDHARKFAIINGIAAQSEADLQSAQAKLDSVRRNLEHAKLMAELYT